MDSLRPYYLSLVSGFILLILFLISRVKTTSLKATLQKGVTSIFFIMTFLTAFAYAGKEYIGFGIFICLGLVFGMLGDIFLDLKYVYPQDNDAWTYAGFIAFMFGHLFYLFAVIGQVGFSYFAAAIGVGGYAAAIGFLLLGEKPMKLHFGKFKPITAIYGGLLLATAVFMTTTAIITHNAGVLMMAIGGALFLVSDLILTGTYFGEGKNRPVDIITNHVTYYAAQFVIASSVLLLDKTF